MDSLQGKLLIAAPSLIDPNFSRTVVLIAAHSDEGALGLVLNRPLDTPLAEIAPVLENIAEPGALLHQGGPGAPETALLLAEFDDPSLAALLIFGDTGLPLSSVELTDLEAGVRRVRVFAGHSGWGPGQLDDELEQEAWFVGQLAPDELWLPDSTALWANALLRKGGAYAILARMPEDPSVN
ncbi:MAG: YqgE/AlgH family protein [Solirubrobacteraceae bacterium]|jgi:putative transcriptional regulator